tara:strand:- start:135 stop:1211 length:1077 start_codon:yes stop_codon:yes gene_type:complete
MSKAAELANLIGNINAGGGGVNRNLIINGNFVVAQRGTSFSNVTTSQFCLDRFSVDVGGGGAFNVTQDSSAPEGFEKSLKLEVNTADSSIAVGDAYRITQAIEGQDITQVDLGASTAKAMALSFYVKSSVTGTYGIGLANSAETENFVAEYTINSANTWEKKTINIPVRTSGTWLTTNGIGIGVRFDLGSGTNYNGTAGQWQTTSSKVYRTSSCVNLIATGSATWQITGVQLEVGQNPTSFEHEPFERTFLKCQRYFQKSYPHGNFLGDNTGNGAVGYYATSDADRQNITWALPMRAAPDMSIQRKNGGGANQAQRGNNAGTYADLSSITAVSTGLEFLQDATNDAHFRFHYYADAEL